MFAEAYKKMFLSLLPKNLERFSREKKDSPIDGLRIYVLAWALSFVFSLTAFSYAAIKDGISSAITGQLGFVVEGPLALVAFLALALMGLAWGLATVYVAQYAGCYAARNFFSGKGTFESQLHLNMLFTGAIMATISALALVGTFLPLLGFLPGLLATLLSLYGLYLAYLAMKSLHRMGATGAIVSVLVIFFTNIIALIIIESLMAVLMLVLGVVPLASPPA